MRIEIIIIGITALILVNIYTDGKYSQIYLTWKKQIQMAVVALVGISLYLVVRRNPAHCKHILHHANNVVKYMPIDKTSMSFITPILDITSSASKMPFLDEMNHQLNPSYPPSQYPMMQQPQQQQKATKRSVSETKKKYVASMQNWKCGECSAQLNAWFEVDHRTRLEYGGSNEVSNLVALCRECHGKKTAMENM